MQLPLEITELVLMKAFVVQSIYTDKTSDLGTTFLNLVSVCKAWRQAVTGQSWFASSLRKNLCNAGDCFGISLKLNGATSND